MLLRGRCFLHKMQIWIRLRVPAVLLILLDVFDGYDAASHSLKYSYTAVTPGNELPEFTAVGTVDDVQFMYYDSNIRRMIPKTEWINESEGADYWERERRILMDQQQFLTKSVSVAREHFNKLEGVHTLQNMFGCEWDSETGSTERFDHYGYDKEDFITLNNKFWSFMALVPEAEFLIQKWNDASDQLEHRKQFLTQECVERLMKYVRYGNSSLERTAHVNPGDSTSSSGIIIGCVVGALLLLAVIIGVGVVMRRKINSATAI